MIDEKIARVKTLIQQREKIDAELASLFGMTEQAKRGRPRKEPGNGAGVARGTKTCTGGGRAGRL